MKDSRPVFLNLLHIRFPVTAIASILHRFSGVLLFFAVPLLLGVLQKTLVDEAAFNGMMSCLRHPIMRLITWFFLAGMTYHALAGLRHLLADMGHGESLRFARLSAYGMFVLAAILMALEAVWLW